MFNSKKTVLIAACIICPIIFSIAKTQDFLIILGALATIYNFAPDNTSDALNKKNAIKIGGLLWLLIIGLMFFNPIWELGSMYSVLNEVEKNAPNIANTPLWVNYKYANWFGTVVSVCLSFIAGFGLYNKRDDSAVNRAKIILWLIFPLSPVVFRVIIPYAVAGKLYIDENLFLNMALRTAIAAICSYYLSSSIRVKTTYYSVATESTQKT
jgi:hypothetical protein